MAAVVKKKEDAWQVLFETKKGIKVKSPLSTLGLISGIEV